MADHKLSHVFVDKSVILSPLLRQSYVPRVEKPPGLIVRERCALVEERQTLVVWEARYCDNGEEGRLRREPGRPDWSLRSAWAS